MLKTDSIVQRYPQYLPTDEEVHAAERLAKQPGQEDLWDALCQRIAIGGCCEASLRRFCWQARQQKLLGDACAQGAIAWLRRCMATRARLGMDTVLSANGPFTEAFRQQFTAAVPFSVHGTDRKSHPVFIIRWSNVDITAFAALWQEGERLQKTLGLAVNAAVLFQLRTLEYITNIVMAQESKRQGCVVDRCLFIMDVGGVGLRHLKDPSLQEFFQCVSKESTDLFPETMHATVIAHAPWMLSNAIWPLLRSILHPVTRDKLLILSSPEAVRAKLADLIAAESLPPYFGGRCSCAECLSGQLRGGSLQAWEDQKGDQFVGVDSTRSTTRGLARGKARLWRTRAYAPTVVVNEDPARLISFEKIRLEDIIDDHNQPLRRYSDIGLLWPRIAALAIAATAIWVAYLRRV